MKLKKISGYLLLISAVLASFASCDSQIDGIEESTLISTGAFVLNEGAMNKNNASLTYYDFATGLGSNDIFLDKNSRGLGDTGQDLISYGSKLYIAVYGSNTIEVLNLATGKSINTITFQAPRSMTSANGKIYIVQFDGHVAQMDTSTFAIEKTISVGSGPNKSVISKNKLYVANSGTYATKGNTVSVINLSTFTETKKIVVNLNPYGDMHADSDGDVYIASNGDYGAIPAKFQRIDALTDEVTDINIPVQGFVINNDKAYIFNFTTDFSTWKMAVGSATIAVYDVKLEKKISDNIIVSTDVVETPYSIAVDPVTENIFLGVTDYATVGKIHCFDSTGKSKSTFSTGVNPSKIVFTTKK